MKQIIESDVRKCLPPKVSDSLVVRGIYHQLIANLLIKKIHICVAPAGYGKTTLLGQCHSYFQKEKISTLWVSLDDLESTPRGFINTLTKIAGELISKVVGQNSRQSEKLQLNMFLEFLSHFDRPLIIFLDDYHLIDNNLIAELMNTLLTSANDNVHFCLISKNDPRFFYASYLLEGTASLIDVDNFKFSRKNVDEYILDNVSIERTLSEQEHQMIYNKTEGWPIAVQLCCLLINQNYSTKFIEGFSGRDKDLGDFLNEKVFHALPESLQKFTALSSLFGDFNAELCDEVLGINNSKQLINEVYRQKLFIYSLDRNKNWFRYHHIFREFLFTTQWQPEHKNLISIYVRAAQWSFKNFRFSDAIDYALQAKDFKFVKEILLTSAKTIVRDEGLLPNLLLWIDKIPASDTTESMELHYWLAWSLAFTCRIKEAEIEVGKLEISLKKSKQLPKAEIVKYQSRITSLKLVTMNFQDMGGEGYKSSDDWIKKFRKVSDPFDVAMVAGVRFLNAKLRLEIVEARKALTLMRKSLVDTESSYGKLWLTIFECCFEMEFGSYQVAAKILELEYKSLYNVGKTGTVIRYTLALLLAKITYEKGEFDRATELLSDGYVHILDHGFTDTAAAGLEVNVKITARNDMAAAMCLLNQAEFTLSHFGPHMLFIVHKLRFELLLFSGETDRAIGEAKIAGVEIIDGKVELQNTELGSALVSQQKILIGIALLFHMKYFAEMEKQIGQLLDSSSTRQRAKFHVELLILLSAVLYQSGNKQQACRTVIKALHISSNNGLYNIFNDNKYYLLPVFKELVIKRVQKDDLPEDVLFSQLVSDFGIVVDNEIDNNAIVDEVTQREKELLSLLQTDLSVQGLADHLFLSKSTVKWHLANIYKKLGVKNRTGALVMSEKLGLIK